MKAEYTIKIGDVFYKAGEELPENWDSPEEKASEIKEEKAAAVSAVEPPTSEEEKPVEEQPAKRKYTRRR